MHRHTSCSFKLPHLERLTLDSIEIAQSEIAALKQLLPKTDVGWTPPTEANEKRIKSLFGAR
jgi:hypothetical protein